MRRFLKSIKAAPAASDQIQSLAHGPAFKRLLIAGQIGMDATGQTPDGLEAQLELAFDNLLSILEAAQLAVGDLVRIVVYVTVPGSLALAERVRRRKIGSATPVAAYLEISGLGDPRWLVSIEGEAVQEASP